MSQDKFSYSNLCESCTHKSCCTDFAEPLLFPSDISKLEQIGKFNSYFIDEMQIDGKSIKIIKRKDNTNSCVFWDEKKKVCGIYENRPYDCRMFPFDIDLVDGEFYWIIYSCNPKSDWSWTEQHLQKLENDPQFDDILLHMEYFKLTSLNYVDITKEPPSVVLRKVKKKVFD